MAAETPRSVRKVPRGGGAAAGEDRPATDPGEEETGAHAGVRGRRRAFLLLAYLFAAVMLGTTLPTPLYVLYQAQWHFSATTVTLIFAVYAAGVLAALLLAGSSSDQVGRRPVLAAALGSSAVSTAVFIVAPSLGWLFVARILSGLSAGLVTGTATAALTETGTNPRRSSRVATAANMGGLALGPLVAGLFAQYGSNPTVLVFEVYLGILALAAVALLLVRESVVDRSRLSLRFHGLGIPQSSRQEYLAAGLAGFVAFSLLGLFSALAPSFLGQVLHETNHAVEGAVVFAMFGSATVTQLVAARFESRRVVFFGLAVFLVALALIVSGLSAASLAVFVVGAVVGGIGAGSVFLGSLATANRLAPPAERGRVVSTFFVFCYVGLTIPVIGVGIASVHVGDFRAVLVCSIVLAVLSLVSIAGMRRAAITRP